MFFKSCIYLLVPAAMLTAQTPPPTPKITPGTLAPAAPAAAAPTAVSPDTVVLKVGDDKITAAQFELFIQSLPPQFQNDARGPKKRAFAENYAHMLLLAQDAQKRKLDQDPLIQKQIQFNVQNVLAAAEFQDLMKTLKPTDADYQKYYDAHKAEFEQVKASHILIRYKGSRVPIRPGTQDLTEEQALARAQELRKKLIAGEDFAKLATSESDDQSTPGGSLGAFGRHQMTPAFEQSAFALPVGEVSQPVKTEFGYHLIKVEKHDSKTLAEIKASPEVDAAVKQTMIKQHIDDMSKDGSLMINDGFFGPSTEAAK